MKNFALILVVFFAVQVVCQDTLECNNAEYDAQTKQAISGKYCGDYDGNTWSQCGSLTNVNNQQWFQTKTAEIVAMNEATCLNVSQTFCRNIGATGGEANQAFCCSMPSVCSNNNGCVGLDLTKVMAVGLCCNSCLKFPAFFGCENVDDTSLRHYCAYNCANPPCLVAAAPQHASFLPLLIAGVVLASSLLVMFWL